MRKLLGVKIQEMLDTSKQWVFDGVMDILDLISMTFFTRNLGIKILHFFLFYFFILVFSSFLGGGGVGGWGLSTI